MDDLIIVDKLLQKIVDAQEKLKELQAFKL